MPKPTDHTGQTYGACHVIGRVPGEAKRWRTECTNCGRTTVRSSDSLRVMKRLGGYEGCNGCAIKTFAHLAGLDNTPRRDSGVRWTDGEGFKTTKLGKLQQDFYTGKMNGNKA